jgi:hypothetical protein
VKKENLNESTMPMIREWMGMDHGKVERKKKFE